MYIFIRPANFCGEVYGLSLEPSRVPHCYCFGLFLKQFDYDVPWLCMCLCVGIHPIWGLIQILNMWVYNFPPIWKNFSHSKKYIFMAPLGGLHLLYINPISSLEVWMLSILHEGNSLFNVLNYSLSSRMRHGTNGKKVISILLA